MTIYRVYFRSISNPNGPSEYCDFARVEAAAEVLMHMKGAFLISTIEVKPGPSPRNSQDRRDPALEDLDSRSLSARISTS